MSGRACSPESEPAADLGSDPGAAARWLREATGADRIDAGLVLGSGWAGLTRDWGRPRWRAETGEVPGFLAPVAQGHRGELLLYDLPGARVLVCSGRTHLYEGHGPGPVTHGVRTMAAWGADRVILTNANGSLREDWEIGRPILIRDHLSTSFGSPLTGPEFVDLTDAWSARWRARARALEPSLAEGVYAHLRGPHYNTVAEADWLRRIGADLVGMSTVPEAIAARAAGMELLGLSAVSAIEGREPIDGDEVVAAVEAAAVGLGPLVARLLAP